MKSIKTITAALLIVISASAFANDGTSNLKNRMDYAVGKYVNAVSLGNNADLAGLLHENAKYTLTHNNEVKNYTGSDLRKMFKNEAGTVQNCQIEQKVLEAGDSQAIVKVSMKYHDFTKVNYVTFINTFKGWKISNISASYN